MEQKYYTERDLEIEREYSTGEREFPRRKKEEEPWADTLEEADLI